MSRDIKSGNYARRENADRHWKVSEEERKRRQAEIPPDTRSVTGRLAGDPLPGRSALDMELRQ